LRWGVWALVSLLAVLFSACSDRGAHPAAPTSAYPEPRWEGLLDPPPELLVAIRPQALRRDKVYGPLLRRAIELAREQSRVVAATRALETLEDADEVIIGARDPGPDSRREASLVIVLLGVRADIDPARLVDDNGRFLWVPAMAGPVRELMRAPSERDSDSEGTNASLFELPGRTWVIASGGARPAARATLAQTRTGAAGSSEARERTQTRTGAAGSSEARERTLIEEVVDLAPEAVAMLRLSGPALVARTRALRPPGLLAPLGRDLAAVTVVLSGGDDAVLRATLSYNAPQAVAPAESTLHEALEALSRAKSPTFAWLRAASTKATGSSLVLTTPLPLGLTDALVHPTPE
jgi:hypothetical protein